MPDLSHVPAKKRYSMAYTRVYDAVMREAWAVSHSEEDNREQERNIRRGQSSYRQETNDAAHPARHTQ